MQFTKRERDIPRSLFQLGTVLALGVACAVTGPFGTYQDLATGARYAYWLGLVLFGATSIWVSATAVAALRPNLAAGWRIAFITLASAVPTTFAVAWAESMTRLTHPIPLELFPRVYACVALIQLLIVVVLARQRPPAAQLPSTPEAGAADVPVQPFPHQPFMARVPAHLGQELLALGAEDHYLRIITRTGSDLVLMRLGDAMKELHADSGLQVHRSWWVAHDAVTSIRRDGARVTLVLTNGQEVPVSRTYLAAVRAADWPRTEVR